MHALHQQASPSSCSVGLTDSESVLSEVHMETCPPLEQGSMWCTTFPLPNLDTRVVQQHADAQVDDEGDLIVDRRRSQRSELTVHHGLKTPLREVGLQVWRGALLLGDFLLAHQAIFTGCFGLELGCGCGLAGLVLALVADRVLLTDTGPCILENCQHNANANKHLFRRGVNAAQVRELNWGRLPWEEHTTARSPPFGWQADDTARLHCLDVLLAADAVYDDSLTEALLRCAEQLLTIASNHIKHPWQGLYMALEKRLNFTLQDMDAVAPAYDHFRTFIETSDSRVQGSLCGQTSMYGSKLQGRQIPLEAIPHILPYQRSRDLELWHITLS